MKYQLKIIIDIEAFDDPDARDKVETILCTCIVPKDNNYICKLHKIYDNQPPRKLRLLTGGKDG